MIAAVPIFWLQYPRKISLRALMSRKMLAGKMKGERRSKRRGQSVEVRTELALLEAQAWRRG